MQSNSVLYSLINTITDVTSIQDVSHILFTYLFTYSLTLFHTYVRNTSPLIHGIYSSTNVNQILTRTTESTTYRMYKGKLRPVFHFNRPSIFIEYFNQGISDPLIKIKKSHIGTLVDHFGVK